MVNRGFSLFLRNKLLGNEGNMNWSMIFYIFGYVFSIESICMLMPSVVGLIYREKEGIFYLVEAIILFAVAFLILLKKPQKKTMFAREGFVIVGLSWFIMSAIGAIPLVLTGEVDSFVDAFFEITSGFTTTGSSVITDFDKISHVTLFWRSLTHWIGGMGVFVFLMAVMPMTGAGNLHLMRAESPGPSVSKLVPRIKDTAKILYAIYIAMSIADLIALLIAGMPLFEAMLTMFGTAGTGGFGFSNDGLTVYGDAVIWITTIGMTLFGVNFNVYFYLLSNKKKEAFKIEEVHWYFSFILISVAIITWNIKGLYGSLYEAIRDASFHVCSLITSTGYACADFNLWPNISRTILMLIMFTGACAGSTGGGIKISRFVIFVKSLKKELISFVHPRSVKAVEMDGKTVDKDLIRSVFVFISTYFLLFGISVFLLSFDHFDLVTNFTTVLTALSNIGPGLETVGPYGTFAGFSDFSKCIIIFDMIAGRLELFPVLMLLVPGTWKK